VGDGQLDNELLLLLEAGAAALFFKFLVCVDPTTHNQGGHNCGSVAPWPASPSGPASTAFERQSLLAPLCVSYPLPDSVFGLLPFGCHKAAY
jgi:hypothetical protein